MNETTPMSLQRQLELGALVCPLTRERLEQSGDELVSTDGSARYPILKGAPLLLADPKRIADELKDAGSMEQGYHAFPQRSALRRKFDRWRTRDFKPESFWTVLRETFGGSDRLYVSVGGGPLRALPSMVNLNIGPYPNVEVVADAYALPYADNTVDAVYCDAVLEHLVDPHRAVAEMHRVIKPGGKALAVTPFLQGYHGYPSHFQNFTLSGHEEIFKKHGFIVEESGTAGGPIVAISDLVSGLITMALPEGRLRAYSILLWQTLSAPARRLDRILGTRKGSHVLASTTFVLARKIP